MTGLLRFRPWSWALARSSNEVVLRASGVASSLGSAPVRTAVLAVALAALVRAQRWRQAAFVVLVVSAVHLADRAAKSLLHRSRPAFPARGYALDGTLRSLVVLGILVVGGAALGRRTARWALLVVPAFGASILLVHLIGLVPVGVGADSLPSGHASNTAALAIALTFVRPQGRRWTWVAVAGWAFVVAVGISRVTLGFHRPEDVLLGWALAAVVAGPMSSAGRWGLTGENPDQETPHVTDRCHPPGDRFGGAVAGRKDRPPRGGEGADPGPRCREHQAP